MAKSKKAIHVNQTKKIESKKIKIDMSDHKVRNLFHASYQQNATGVGAMKSKKTYDRNRSKKQTSREISNSLNDK